MAVQLGARLVAVAEACRAKVTATWPPALPDEVIGEWLVEDDLATMDGRKVCVLPAGAKTVQHLTRGHLLNEYAVSVRVVERYTERDRPPVDWINDRVTFLDTILLALDVFKDADRLLGTLWTETIEVTDASNLTELMVRKLFWAEIEVTFREKAAA